MAEQDAAQPPAVLVRVDHHQVDRGAAGRTEGWCCCPVVTVVQILRGGTGLATLTAPPVGRADRARNEAMAVGPRGWADRPAFDMIIGKGVPSPGANRREH
ncbi:hypothetical protein SSIG_03129 [Streptomyces filamentosus NRRL 11379]|uniref:Predicted protein n=1 Tax=Streptomyces filamentosus NRRL 15998 TaxID=457431 RepID=D6ANG5_STRFL|nr:predicted protein [Streptomyces filamentosus NRRL 15998]EWS92602.1 hypothetical protein SSIG_03129 [Streptomyces filamentosus NRRL 11379]